jgi:hypothetical protein
MQGNSFADLNLLVRLLTPTFSIFCQHTSDGQDIPGTRLGFEAIKQCISALEYWRYNNQHREDYKQCPASRIPLRDDSRITTSESTAQEKEPERIAEAQTLKAIGALSGQWHYGFWQ